MNCSLLCVTQLLMFTATSFLAMLSNSLAIPSPLSVQHFDEEYLQVKFNDCFYIITFYFNLLNFLCMGIVNTSFQSAGTGKYATPNGHLNFHFPPSVVSYKVFSRLNQIQLIFFLMEPNNILQFSLEKWPVCSLFQVAF